MRYFSMFADLLSEIALSLIVIQNQVEIRSDSIQEDLIELSLDVGALLHHL